MSSHRMITYFVCSCLMLSLPQICEAIYSFQCPTQSHWRHREAYCNSSLSYFCLYDRNNDNFTEMCREKSEIETPGYKLIVSGSKQGTLHGEFCEKDFYQPLKFSSSENSRCVYKTSHCSDEGQVIYRNGTPITDSLCRCDHTGGYDFIIRPQNRCFCVPSEEDCSCYLKTCPFDDFLSPDYECFGENEWKEKFNCEPKTNVDGTDDTSTIMLTDGDINHEGTTGTETDRFSWPWVPLIVTLLVLVCIGIECIVNAGIKELHKRRNGLNKNENSYKTPQNVSDLQDHIEVLKWRKMNEHFEETRASKTVLNAVKTHGFVIISGPPGSGKSAIAYNTAFKLEKNEEFKIVLVSSTEEIRKYLMPESKQVFVIDDPVGKYTVDETSIQRWKNEETFIKHTFPGCTNTKLILTCRAYIYNSPFCCQLKVLPIQFDLLSHDLQLSSVERRKMCQRYNIPDLNEETIMMYDFFPLLCALYSTNDDTIRYFTNPYKVLREEMMNIKENSDIAFLALALLVVQDNKIDRQLLSFENHTIKELLNDMCNECGFKYFPLTTVLQAALYHLIGTYVKENDNGFACIHDTLFNNLSFIVGSSIIHCLLKHGSCKFVANRLQLASIQEKHTDLIIIVKPEQEKKFFQRLLGDIRKGYHNDVFTGIQMKYSRFRLKLLTFLENSTAEDLKYDENSSTPLHVVSEQGYDDLVYTLYQMKKDQLNLQDKDKRTPLFMACLGRHNKVIKTLLAIDNSSLHVANNKDLTPVDVASINDDVSTLTVLLEFGAKVNRKDSKINRTALQRACENGSYNAVTFLLNKNANLNQKDRNGLKAIHIACSKGHLEIAELLLKHDRNMINECDNDGRTPMFTSCECDQQHIVMMLLKNKANVNRTNVKGKSPLYIACKIGNENIVGLLLEYSANVNVQSDNGSSPLYIACLHGNVKIVELLLHNDAEVNISTDRGTTPFLISCSKGYLEICKLLLHRGANINTDKPSLTPLHIACKEKHELIVKLLIECGANINAVNRKKESALYFACMNEYLEIAQLLLNNKADPNICEEEGNSPLHVACLKGNKQIVRLLLDKKADIHKRNKVGKTQCEVVQGLDTDIIVEMLNRYKSK